MMKTDSVQISVTKPIDPQVLARDLGVQREKWTKQGSKKSPVSRCHYSPQGYFKRILNDHPIHVVFKANDGPVFFNVPVQAEDICMEMDLYSRNTATGWDQTTLEHHFEFLENKWPRLVERIQTAQLTSKSQWEIANFVVELILRNPRMLRTTGLPPGDATEIILRRVAEFASPLLSEYWRLLSIPQGLITGDFPVLFTWRFS